MQIVSRPWSEVFVGAYIKDKQAKTWRIEDERDGWLLLTDRENRPTSMRRPTEGHVYVCEPTESEAIALLKREMDVTLVGVKVRGEPMRCPPLPHQLMAVHGHLYSAHGFVTDTGPGSKSLSKLLEFHREDHLDESGRSHAYRHHLHVKGIDL